jgi:hypothetical protein
MSQKLKRLNEDDALEGIETFSKEKNGKRPRMLKTYLMDISGKLFRSLLDELGCSPGGYLKANLAIATIRSSLRARSLTYLNRLVRSESCIVQIDLTSIR